MIDPIFRWKNITNIPTQNEQKKIELTLNHSEIHALIVKSSSEQNELINFISNLLEYEIGHGKLYFNNTIIKKRPATKFLISILHNTLPLVNDLTVAENLFLPNLPKTKIFKFINWKKVKLDSQKKLLELDFQINSKSFINSLTEEEKRLVYITRIFLHNPEIIIMHEPLEGLSIENKQKIYTIIKHFKEEGKSILYITKQWEDAFKLADRISVFSKGEIIEEVSAEIAKSDPQSLLQKIEGYQIYENQIYNDHHTKQVLDAIFKAAEFLTSEYELKDILLLLAKEVSRVMKAENCSIQLIDDYTWSIIDEFEYKNNKNLHGILTQETILEIVNGKEIYYCNENDTRFNTLFLKHQNIKTIVCIPVFIRSQVTGIIQLSYEDIFNYSIEESKYLIALASHAAIAIEDTRLLGRSTLLQESHHRIKNNLQSIISIISLQKSFIKDVTEIDNLLDSIISRIKSIASVHNLLSKDELGRSIINVKEIIISIIQQMNNQSNITLHYDLDDIFIPYNKATSIALIINELVMNCYKHAFPNSISGTIQINCKRQNENLILSIIDDGIGLHDNFNINHSTSLGLTILKGIVKSDFLGELSIKSDSNFTTAKIILPTERIFLHW